MNVFDASAVPALIQNEPGAGIVEAVLSDAVMASANLVEVAGKLVDAGIDGRRAGRILQSGGTIIEPLTMLDCETAAALR